MGEDDDPVTRYFVAYFEWRSLYAAAGPLPHRGPPAAGLAALVADMDGAIRSASQAGSTRELARSHDEYGRRRRDLRRRRLAGRAG